MSCRRSHPLKEASARLDNTGRPCAVPRQFSIPRGARPAPFRPCIFIALTIAACFAERRRQERPSLRLGVRDHGGLLFIDLRDHYGLTGPSQVEVAGLALAEKLRPECVVRIEGEVVARTPDTVNANLPTGEVEVRIRSLDVLSEAKERRCRCLASRNIPRRPGSATAFLDLRRESLHANIMKRQAIIWSLRHRMRDAGFFEFQTPILTASSPEGARDYLR